MLMGGLASLVASANAAAPVAGLPAGPGKARLEADCAACHDPGIVASERHDAAGWKGVVETMIDRGATVSDADKAAIVSYLATHFGTRAGAESSGR